MAQENVGDSLEFNWDKTARDFGQFRDLYPESFYRKLHCFGIGQRGQRVLDMGTGSGVIPRHMIRYGAMFTGIDTSSSKIHQAKKISYREGMDIFFDVRPAEKTDFPDKSFDAITACQSFMYFNRSLVLQEAMRILSKNGYLAIMNMAWLPGEDNIANESEKLVLKYNPRWKGAGHHRVQLSPPNWLPPYFRITTMHSYDELIPFTRESWVARLRGCRGIGNELTPKVLAVFEKDLMRMLDNQTTDSFSILHQITYLILQVRERGDLSSVRSTAQA